MKPQTRQQLTELPETNFGNLTKPMTTTKTRIEHGVEIEIRGQYPYRSRLICHDENDADQYLAEIRQEGEKARRFTKTSTTTTTMVYAETWEPDSMSRADKQP